MNSNILKVMAMLNNRIEPSYTDFYPDLESTMPWEDRFFIEEQSNTSVSTLDADASAVDPINWFHPWWNEIGFPNPPVGYGDLPAHIRLNVNIPLTDVIRKRTDTRPYVNVRTEMQRRFKKDGVSRRVHCGIDIPGNTSDALYSPWNADYETFPNVSGAGKVIELRLRGVYKVFSDKVISLDGITLRYFHLSKFSVPLGTGSLNVGDKVGYVGKYPTQSDHLHLEVWWKDPKTTKGQKVSDRRLGICVPPQQLFELRSLPCQNIIRNDEWNF